MKFKHLIIIGLIITLISISTVSASEDMTDKKTIQESMDSSDGSIDINHNSNNKYGSNFNEARHSDVSEDIFENQDSNKLSTTNSISKDDFEINYEESISINHQDYVVFIIPRKNNFKGKIEFYINNTKVITKNIDKNKNINAVLNLNDLKINSIGNYNIKLVCIPNNGQKLTLTDYTLKVTPPEGYGKITISICDLCMYYPSNSYYSSDFIIVSNNANINDGQILVYIDDNLYYEKPITKKMKICLKDLNNVLSLGKHYVKVYYKIDNTSYLVKSRMIQFYFEPEVSAKQLIAGSIFSGTVSVPKDFTGKLYMTFNGNTKRLTYKEGKAKFSFSTKNLKPGKHYDFYFRVYGDSKYPTKLFPQYISIRPSVDYYGPLYFKSIKKVKRSAKKLILKASLKQNLKPLKNKKIIFKFKGKKYTAKTNKKGIAKVTINKSTLKKLKAGKKVTYSASYLKYTLKKTATVTR